MLKKIHVAGTLEDCRALINQIIVALSAEEPLDVSSATELLFYLERVNSAEIKHDGFRIIARKNGAAIQKVSASPVGLLGPLWQAARAAG